MLAPAVTPAVALPRRPRQVAAAPPQPVELDTVASAWQLALDAAESALGAARGCMPGADLDRRGRELVQERQQTAELLARLAEVVGARPVPWLSPVPVHTQLLGLPAAAKACLFDLDGVLTDSAVLHASAWAEVFDEFLLRLSEKTGVTALTGARRYLEAAGHAGLDRAVVSASASTLPMLELARLATLVEDRVDADVVRVEGLRSRPAPDLLLAACSRLGVRPEEAVTLTHSPSGVVAGHAAGLTVIGVGDGAHAELLRGFGAERVVTSLSALLDRRLAESRPPLSTRR